MLSEKPWKLESVLKAILAIIGCLLVVQLMIGGLQHFLHTELRDTAVLGVITALSLEGVILVVAIFFLRAHSISWSDAFGFKLNVRWVLLLGLVAGILLFLIGGLMQTVSVKVLNQSLRHYEVKAVQEEAVRVIKTAESWQGRLIFALIAVLLAPLAEEISFRGILYPAMKQLGSRHLALWVTSLLFALIHSDVNAMLSLHLLAFASSLGTFIPLTVLAVAFTLLYEKTGNLLAPIAAHSSFNAINLLILFLFNVD